MTLLSIAELCTFALIAWLLWLEHREEMCALADPGMASASQQRTTREVSSYQPTAK